MTTLASKTLPSQLDTQPRFGEWLVGKGLLNQRKLSEALTEQQISGNRLGQILTRLNLLSDTQVTELLAEFLSIPSVQLDDISRIDIRLARQIPENIAQRFCLLAVRECDNQVLIALADPLDVVARDTVRLKLNRDIQIALCPEAQIRRAIEAVYRGSDIEERRLRDLVRIEVEQDQQEAELAGENLTVADISDEAAAGKVPVIRFVDLLLSQAIKSHASDIHIEPQEHAMSIRMRVDGNLRSMVPPSRKMQNAVVTRIKILSKMNIAERRLPQDGRFKIKTSDRAIDVRVSAIPTLYGEKVVLRILDIAAINHDLDRLGFEPRLLHLFKLTLAQPHGIIIVTGPTGSGKSTTLYSALNYLKDPRKNLTTVEDPVEYRLAGINQIQVKPEVHLDFALCLRAILRQDPDIIMIGEIRDKETLEIAMKAALTGHLVLTTFHTNDAPATLSRLKYMGTEPYLLASTLNLVIAQRLIRRICPHCKQPTHPSPELLKRLPLPSPNHEEMIFYHGCGCENCGHTGYRGRLPVFEFLPLDNQIRQSIVENATEAQLRFAARKKGYGSLMDNALSRLTQGVTTLEEVLSITFTEDVNTSEEFNTTQ